MSLGSLATRAIARFYAARDIQVTVAGAAFVPADGPVLLAARHYHHLYDGAALVDGLDRRLRIFVALDWATTPRVRSVMELACRWADWPVALRSDALRANAASAYATREIAGYVRRSLAHGARILADGGALVVFPEGYPTIDPAGPRKASDDAFLPFAPGLLSIVALAQRRLASEAVGAPLVPIVPVGLRYVPAASPKRFAVAVRIGAPRFYDPRRQERQAFLAELEAAVRTLSLGDDDSTQIERDVASARA